MSLTLYLARILWTGGVEDETKRRNKKVVERAGCELPWEEEVPPLSTDAKTYW